MKWVMVAGPYRGGSSSPEVWAGNWRKLNEAALALFDAGMMPIVGVNAVKPMAAAGADPAAVEAALMDPICLELIERCDACLRIGGPSSGADAEVQHFRQLGKPVYFSLEELLDNPT